MRAEADEASIEYEATGAGRLAPPLVLGQLVREWAFSELRGDSLEEVGLEHGIQIGGLVHQLHDFGPTFRDSDVFFPDGSSLPPAGIAGVPEDPIGGRSQLRQTQSFIKRAPDASLSFRLSTAFIETTDLNAVLGRRCPPVHADGLFCNLVKGDLFLDVQAFTVPAAPDIIPFNTFFHVAGGATVSGFAENWNSDAGLEPADVADLDAPAETPVQPAPCPPGSTANAGSLQFSAAGYSVGESNPTPPVRVIRAGGSTGPVTATITTSDGSAVAGTDYTPVHSSVFFADGDDTPRAVEVPLLRGGEGDRTLTITLTEPGGCGTLGSLASAELTIRDENPAPPVQPVGLDPTFGTGGKATTTAFGGDRSSMALQTDGKIVMAGGTFTAFVLARFDADGTLDDSFGSGGTVTTNIAGQQEALGVAIQPDPDGRIVVAGYADRDDITVARYWPDGRADLASGTGGTLTLDGFVGADLAVQPDGRLVLVGTADTTPPTSPPGSVTELSVMRLEPDGTPDRTFGDNGTVNVSVTGLSSPAGAVCRDSGSALALQPRRTNRHSRSHQRPQPELRHRPAARRRHPRHRVHRHRRDDHRLLWLHRPRRERRRHRRRQDRGRGPGSR